MASGRRMPRSSENLLRGKILPLAMPVKSGTRHSTSVTRFSSSQRSISLKVVNFCKLMVRPWLIVCVFKLVDEMSQFF